MIQAFRAANDVLQGAVQGIADLIVRPGLINVDFADVRTVMSEMGLAMMGTGTARGDDRAQAAAEAAIQNPLLDDVNLAGANGILVNITAGADFTMAEFDEIGRTIDGFASEDATVVVGTVLDPDMQDEVRVTVVATGLNRAVTAKTQRPGERAPIKLVRNATTGQPEFGEFDTGGDAVSKAVGGMGMGMGLRRPSADTPSSSAPSSSGPAAAELPNDYLDIPAFLRRQAD
jgi:cell division protein FtsZ